MFAPQTLQIRYGDDGLLGQAAAGVGAGQGYLRNLAMQQQQQQLQAQLQNDQANRDQQMQMFNTEQANRLQMAHAMTTKTQAPAGPDYYSMGASPTSSNYFTKSSPLVEAVRTAKQQAVDNAIGSAPLSDSDKTNLQKLAANDHMPFEQVRQLAGDAATRAINSRKESESDATKQASMQATQSRFELSKQVQGLDTQARTLQHQADQIAKSMSLMGQDPSITPPSAFNNDPAGLAQYTQWATITNQLQKLQQQRESLVSSNPQPAAAAPAANNGTISITPNVSHAPPPGYGTTTPPTTQYAEGQVLHSPSTGRVFKIVNGQFIEITNAGT